MTSAARSRSSRANPRFVSLRWRLLLPLAATALVLAMLGAYLLAKTVGSGLTIPQTNLLLQSAASFNERSASLYNRQQGEAQRLAFTAGLARAVAGGKIDEPMQAAIKTTARLAGLDAVILTASDGKETLGLLRVEGQDDYAVSAGTPLAAQPIVQAILQDRAAQAAGLVRTQEGLMLMTGVPIKQGAVNIGAALVGHRLTAALADMQASTLIKTVLYGPDGTLLSSTLAADTMLALTAEPAQQALNPSDTRIQSLTIAGEPFQAAYFPFVFGPNILGTAAAVAPNPLPGVAETGRQLSALVMAALAGGIIIVGFVLVNTIIIGRVGRITRTAQALAAGQLTARTGFKSTDEIGAAGQALDRYADYTQNRQDALRQTLRRHRREAEHLTRVLEALPDGVIVLDVDGKVTLMNEAAQRLLNASPAARGSILDDLTAAVTDALGTALAPGLYALGDPRRVEVGDRVLTAQVIALMDLTQTRTGTVIGLRDITSEVRRERAREALLNRASRDLQQPIAELARAESSRQPNADLPRALARHAAALQKLVVEMRELTLIEVSGGREGHRPLLLDTLIWTVANEWRQIAQSANLTLEVNVERKGLYVLGDERRLRWAIGNLVDNAIKYTPPGGRVALDVRGEAQNAAQMRVRDNGAGISDSDLPHIFTRFYRGTPIAASGRVIRAPGTGQGLTIARQIIESHGGRIEVRSKAGQGTAVFFSLPVTAPVSLSLPQLQGDMEGETVQIRGTQSGFEK